MNSSLPTWIRIDSLFGPLRSVVRFTIEPLIRIRKPNGGNVVVMKFFGMGSIIRLMSLCEENEIDLSRIVLVTFRSNAELCKIWGVRGIFVENTSLWKLMVSSMSAVKQISRLSPQLLVDLERVSHLTGTLRTIIAWQAGCKSIGYEMTSRESSTVRIFGIDGLSQAVILDTALKEFPVTSIKRNALWMDIKPGKVIININTSSLLPARRYDRDQFADVIHRLLASRQNVIVFLTGTSDEREYVQHLAQRFDNRTVINVAGEWTLTRYIDELSDCELFITGDSAPLHLAASMRVATIALWGPTQPGHFGYQQAAAMTSLSLHMNCSPCFIHPRSRPALACAGEISCMRNLTPAMIESAAHKMMSEIPSSREIIFPSKYVPVAANAFA